MATSKAGDNAGGRGALEALQHWFSDQCDGDWEHSFGVKLETVDNPGWSLTVDLAETPWADLRIPFTRIGRSEGDWIEYRAEGSVFTAAAGPCNLAELVRVFLDCVGGASSR